MLWFATQRTTLREKFSRCLPRCDMVIYEGNLDQSLSCRDLYVKQLFVRVGQMLHKLLDMYPGSLLRCVGKTMEEQTTEDREKHSRMSSIVKVAKKIRGDSGVNVLHFQLLSS